MDPLCKFLFAQIFFDPIRHNTHLPCASDNKACEERAKTIPYVEPNKFWVVKISMNLYFKRYPMMASNKKPYSAEEKRVLCRDEVRFWHTLSYYNSTVKSKDARADNAMHVEVPQRPLPYRCTRAHKDIKVFTKLPIYREPPRDSTPPLQHHRITRDHQDTELCVHSPRSTA